MSEYVTPESENGVLPRNRDPREHTKLEAAHLPHQSTKYHLQLLRQNRVACRLGTCAEAARCPS